MNSTILAIDLGKFNSVFCWYDPDARAARVPHRRHHARRPPPRTHRQPVARVVFEACSQAGWVHDLCEQLGLPAMSPAPPGRPGSGSTSSGRPTATTP